MQRLMMPAIRRFLREDDGFLPPIIYKPSGGGGGSSLTKFTPQYNSGTGSTHTFTFNSLAAENTVVIACSNDGTNDVASATLDGNAMTARHGTILAQGNLSLGAWDYSLSSGGNLDVVVTSGGSQTGVKCFLWQVGSATYQANGQEIEGGENPTNTVLDVNTALNDFLIAVSAAQNSSGTWTSANANLTIRDALTNDSFIATSADNDAAAAGTPLSVQMDFDQTFKNHLGIALAYRP